MSRAVGLPGLLNADIAMLKMRDRQREIEVIKWRMQWIEVYKAELATNMPEVSKVSTTQ